MIMGKNYYIADRYPQFWGNVFAMVIGKGYRTADR